MRHKPAGLLLYICVLAAPLASAPAIAAEFTVSSADDSGAGTLRQAILDANADTAADDIVFDIPGSSVHTIALASTLPVIVAPVTIDGYTQPGANANSLAVGNDAVLQIVLNGNALADHGLQLQGAASSGSTIRGLVINGTFLGSPGQAGAAIRLEQSDGNTIAGNFIGTDAAGATAAGSGDGIFTINCSNNLVGGTSPGDRNLISGNPQYGVHVRGQFLEISDGNRIEGNYLGTNAAGTAALTSGIGINVEFEVTNTAIGGTAPGAGNLISGHDDWGVWIQVATGTTVEGNLIGTDASGSSAIPNGDQGIFLYTAANDNTIGGTTPASRNVISGNGFGGIRLTNLSTGNVIQGNIIGADASGLVAMGNGEYGIRVEEGSDDNTIGGSADGAGNVIAFNDGPGVVLDVDEGDQGVLRSPILGNSIHSNTELGIDLADLGVLGVSPNDANDADAGPNGLQNFPVLTSAILGPDSVSVSGTLNSMAGTAFRLEFFASGACDPAGFGEGQGLLGNASATTDGSGDATFGPLVFALPDGLSSITATATDPDGNTSEFSQCLAAALPTPSPTPSPTASPTAPSPTPTETPTASPPPATVTPTPIQVPVNLPRSSGLLLLLCTALALALASIFRRRA